MSMDNHTYTDQVTILLTLESKYDLKGNYCIDKNKGWVAMLSHPAFMILRFTIQIFQCFNRSLIIYFQHR